MENVRTIDRCAYICFYGSGGADVQILKLSWWCKVIQFLKVHEICFPPTFSEQSAMWLKTMIMIIFYFYFGHHRNLLKFLCIITLLHKCTCTCLALLVLNCKPAKWYLYVVRTMWFSYLHLLLYPYIFITVSHTSTVYDVLQKLW
jgi:hypothetical protein